MNVLVVGGAGYVGNIIRPALEAKYDCRYLDRRAIEGMPKSRMFVGDVLDSKLVHKAVKGADALLYMAMGTVSPKMSTTGHRADVHDVEIAFGVNAAAFYGFAYEALAGGTRRFVYTSSISAFAAERPRTKVMEDWPADAWHPYGMSKRCGELISSAIVQEQPKATAVVLRIFAPRNEEHFPLVRPLRDGRQPIIGPNDTRRLFVSAVGCKKPGLHILHATGDVTGKFYSHARVKKTLGWLPEGK